MWRHIVLTISANAASDFYGKVAVLADAVVGDLARIGRGRKSNFWDGILMLRRIHAWLLVAVCSSSVAADCVPMDLTHAAWTEILHASVDAGQVDYRAIANQRRRGLDDYLHRLSAVCPQDYAQASEHDKIAFWINAYNAYTIDLILKHYPVESIRKIGWLPGAAFRERFIPMDALKGRDISLNDIEHGTLRSVFDEPRVHFALVCAAQSCPPLRNEAYRGSELDHQLDDQARIFLRDRRKNRYNPNTNVLEISAIFDWFRADFEHHAGSVATFIGRYLELPADTPPAVHYQPYDWQLNDRKLPSDFPR